MGNSIGESTIWTVNNGRSIQASADGNPKFKAGGVTIDWSLVPAATVDTTYEDTVTVEATKKGIRYGTVVYRTGGGYYAPATAATTLVAGETFIVNETMLEEDVMSNHPGVLDAGRVFKARLLYGTAAASEVQRITVNATGGTFALAVTINGNTYKTGQLPFNETAGNVQTALQNLLGSGNATVARSGAGPYLFDITFAGSLANTNIAPIVVDSAAATGGTVVQSTTTEGTAGTPTFANMFAAIPGLTFVTD